jgi:hypothetical protein
MVIGNVSPAADFNAAMAAARSSDSADAVNDTMRQLVEFLYSLIDFGEPDEYPAALAACAALRAACLAEEMPATYNAFLQNMYARSAGRTGGGFWATIKAGNSDAAPLGFISTDELPELGGPGGAESPAAAAALMARNAEADVSQAGGGAEEAVDDELFDDLDGMD